MKKEYFVEVHRTFGIWVEAETESEAVAFAIDNAETMKHGVADDCYGDVLEVKDVIYRQCKTCGEINFEQGFCMEDGLYYYCSEECLHADFTEEEYLKAYDEEWAYWTQWEDGE